MSDQSPLIAVDQEARDRAAGAEHKADLAEQAWRHHTEQCERDRKETIATLRDLAAGIKDVDAASRDRAVRQHARLDAQSAILTEIKTAQAAMPQQIAEAIAAAQPPGKNTLDLVGAVFSKVQNWILGGVITALLSFIGYLMFFKNPFVQAIGG